MLKNMKIGTKLILAFCLLSAIALIIGILGYWDMKDIDNNLNEIANNRLPSLKSLLVLNKEQMEINAAERTLLIPLLEQSRIEIESRSIKEAWERADVAWKIYEPLPKTKKEEVLWKKLVPAWEAWEKDHQEFLRLFDEFNRTRDTSTYARLQSLSLDRAAKSFKEAESLLDEMVDLNNQIAVEEGKKAESVASSFIKIFLAACRRE